MHRGRLELRGITIRGGGATLVEGLSLCVEAGERVAVVGPSGIGKTTLLRVVAGLVDPAGGTLSLGGRSPGEIGWPAYRRQVVFVGQRPVMIEGSLRTNLEIAFDLGSRRRGFDEARASALLEAVGMGSARLDQEARTLSEGERQRASLVRALLLRPAFLLLDEPTSGLDEVSRDAVETLVLRIGREEGCGALIVTHDRAQALRLCPEILDLAP